MNITVYLGANAGNDPALAEAVRELGSWIGANGHRLVYGGSRSGLMGQLAQSALDAGGTVTGVEPQFFVQQELQHDGLTELIVTKDMTERKTKMIELGDAFIAFPGGTGTLEEIAEVMSKVSLGQLDAPCILYDLNGYYDSLKALLAKETMFLEYLGEISLTGKNWETDSTPAYGSTLFNTERIEEMIGKEIGKKADIRERGGMTGFQFDELTMCPADRRTEQREENIYNTRLTMDELRKQVKYFEHGNPRPFQDILRDIYEICSERKERRHYGIF